MYIIYGIIVCVCVVTMSACFGHVFAIADPRCGAWGSWARGVGGLEAPGVVYRIGDVLKPLPRFPLWEFFKILRTTQSSFPR